MLKAPQQVKCWPIRWKHSHSQNKWTQQSTLEHRQCRNNLNGKPQYRPQHCWNQHNSDDEKFSCIFILKFYFWFVIGNSPKIIIIEILNGYSMILLFSTFSSISNILSNSPQLAVHFINLKGKDHSLKILKRNEMNAFRAMRLTTKCLLSWFHWQ